MEKLASKQLKGQTQKDSLPFSVIWSYFWKTRLWLGYTPDRWGMFKSLRMLSMEKLSAYRGLIEASLGIFLFLTSTLYFLMWCLMRLY